MSKVILKGFILVADSQREEINLELINHLRLTREEPGCITFHVTQSAQNPARFDVYEEFVDRSAFDAHQRRVRSSVWGKLTQNVERYYEISD
ncbi:MAG: putative quinol monooxygenase [Vibrio sp.]